MRIARGTCSLGALFPALLAVALLLAGVPAGASEVPAAEELVRRVAAAWDPVRVSLKATMTVERRNRPASIQELLIQRAGSGRTRIELLSPARDRGKVILENGGETWLYLPRTDRVVEVPARRNPLAGGVLFEDLFPGGAATGELTVEEQGDAYVLITGGGSAGSRIYFDRSSLLPIRREVYASSGRLLKTVHIDETRDWQGAQIPSRVRVVDHLRHDAEARIEILEASALEGDLEELFSKDNLRPATGDGPEPP